MNSISSIYNIENHRNLNVHNINNYSSNNYTNVNCNENGNVYYDTNLGLGSDLPTSSNALELYQVAQNSKNLETSYLTTFGMNSNHGNDTKINNNNNNNNNKQSKTNEHIMSQVNVDINDYNRSSEQIFAGGESASSSNIPCDPIWNGGVASGGVITGSVATDVTGGWAYGSVTGDASSGEILPMNAGNDSNNNNSMLGVGGYGVNFGYGVPNMSVVGQQQLAQMQSPQTTQPFQGMQYSGGYCGVRQRTYSTMDQSRASINPYSMMRNQSWHAAPQPPQQ